jgi:hypothetical protein
VPQKASVGLILNWLQNAKLFNVDESIISDVFVQLPSNESAGVIKQFLIFEVVKSSLLFKFFEDEVPSNVVSVVVSAIEALAEKVTSSYLLK